MANDIPEPVKSIAEFLKFLQEKGVEMVLKEAVGTQGELSMIKQYSGTIVDIVDDEAGIDLEGPDGCCEYAYHKSQFLGNQLPARSSRIKVLVLAWVEPPEEFNIEDLLTEEEMKEGFPNLDRTIKNQEENT